MIPRSFHENFKITLRKEINRGYRKWGVHCVHFFLLFFPACVAWRHLETPKNNPERARTLTTAAPPSARAANQRKRPVAAAALRSKRPSRRILSRRVFSLACDCSVPRVRPLEDVRGVCNSSQCASVQIGVGLFLADPYLD